MHSYPKIISAKIIQPYIIKIEFTGNIVKFYDFSKQLGREPFSSLKNYAFFKAVKVSSGGYGLEWNDEIDIAEAELWENSVADIPVEITQYP